MTFGDRVLSYYNQLDFNGSLPKGIQIMNPFVNNPLVDKILRQFCKKFYNDGNSRFAILGINPGRFGAGVTGIPFTDTKRLKEKCGIAVNAFQTHEPSSVFVYDAIEEYGGVYSFYEKFYMGAVCPLGFTSTSSRGRTINSNYYDTEELLGSVYDFIIESIKKQLEFGIERDICFCLGTGKNERFLSRINNEHRFFKKLVALEHPRFIMQYRARQKKDYINKYITAFRFV